MTYSCNDACLFKTKKTQYFAKMCVNAECYMHLLKFTEEVKHELLRLKQAKQTKMSRTQN